MLLEQVGFGEQCQELNEGRIGVEATKKGRRQRDIGCSLLRDPLNPVVGRGSEDRETLLYILTARTDYAQ